MLRVGSLGSPLGTLSIVEGSQGILRIAFGRRSSASLIDELGGLFAPAQPEQGVSEATERELSEYFAGERRSFTRPVDLRLVRGFYREVLETLKRRVAFGQVVSYGELAALAGRPKGQRAIGGAMRNNPVPIFVPCHRVIAAGRRLGGFSGGLEKKRRLLAIEGVAGFA